jgi:hypothetical protein
MPALALTDPAAAVGVSGDHPCEAPRGSAASVMLTLAHVRMMRLRFNPESGVLGILAIGLLAAAPSTSGPLWTVVGAAALAAVALFGAGAVCPLLLVLVMFLPEHSQTQWGVRSAADLATFYNTRPLAAVPVSVFDIVVAGSCLAWIATRRRAGFAWRRALMWSRLAAPYTLATAFVLVAAVTGTMRGHEPYHILREARPLLYFLVLFVLAAEQLAHPGRVRQFVRIAIAAGALHGAEGIIRFMLGIGRVTSSGRLMIYFDFADSLALAFTLCLVATYWAAFPRLDRARATAMLLAAVTMSFVFVFSFRRSFWLGLAAAILFVLWSATVHERRRLVALGAASALGVVLVFASVGAMQAASPRASAVPAQAGFVGERLASLTDTTSDPTNRFRIFDTLNAAGAVRDSRGLGMGFGSRYQVVASDALQHEFLEHVSRLSHNSYLYLAMKMGLAGLLAWLWLFRELLRWPLAQSRGGPERHIAVAVAATIITAAVAALFMPLAYNVRPMVLLALIAGLGFAAPPAAPAPEARHP